MRGVTFEIGAGEFVIILGNSGGGKTTLLNILGTIDKPTKVEARSKLGYTDHLWREDQVQHCR